MTTKQTNNCPECQFEGGEHSFECSHYKEMDFDICRCKKLKPNGIYKVGKHEGNYQRCKKCGKKIWS